MKFVFKLFLFHFFSFLLVNAQVCARSKSNQSPQENSTSSEKKILPSPGKPITQVSTDVLLMKSRKDEKSILCDDAKVQKVKVNFGRVTILSFPVVPKEIIPGEAVFDFRQIKSDLAIKSLRPGAHTNIAVYLMERRCSFDLMTVTGGGDDILFVRDPVDRQFEVKFHE